MSTDDTADPVRGTSARHRVWRAVPVTIVVLLLAGGLALACADHWRRGAAVMAVAAGLAGVLRLMLPTWAAGVLAVRSRAFDVLLFVALAAILGVASGAPINTGGP